MGIDGTSLRAIFFDVGETLIDESTEYGTWADWLGVPRHVFSAMFGAVLARGEDYRAVFEHFQPGFDLQRERQRRLEAGMGEYFNARDLYPDARDCLHKLKDAGYFVGIAGNQTSRAGQLLHELHLPADVVLTSDDLGAAKPSTEFFAKMVAAAGVDAPPAQIAYVGDRVDNDMAPAADFGLITILLRRGPWGYIQEQDPRVADVDVRITALADLPALLHS